MTTLTGSEKSLPVSTNIHNQKRRMKMSTTTQEWKNKLNLIHYRTSDYEFCTWCKDLIAKLLSKPHETPNEEIALLGERINQEFRKQMKAEEQRVIEFH